MPRRREGKQGQASRPFTLRPPRLAVQVERVIACHESKRKGVVQREYLVKWCGLEYGACTWEDEQDLAQLPADKVGALHAGLAWHAGLQLSRRSSGRQLATVVRRLGRGGGRAHVPACLAAVGTACLAAVRTAHVEPVHVMRSVGQ